MSEASRGEKFGRIVPNSFYGLFDDRLKTRRVQIEIYGPFAAKETIGMNHKLFYGSLGSYLNQGWTGECFIIRLNEAFGNFRVCKCRINCTCEVSALK